MLALINGFSLCIGLIVSIGPQNTELIRAGLLKQHAYLLASTYILCDVLFIALGILGVAGIISLSPFVEKIISWGSVLILLYLAVQAFNRMKDTTSFMLQPLNKITELTKKKITASKTIKKGLLLSTLNPLVILETIIIIGSTGNQYHGTDKLYFAIGAILASGCWFYAIACSTQWFSHLLSQPKQQRVLEAIVGTLLCCMAIWIAYKKI